MEVDHRIKYLWSPVLIQAIDWTTCCRYMRIPPALTEEPGMAAHISNPRAVEAEARKILGALWQASLAVVPSSKFSERPCIKKASGYEDAGS